MRFGFTFGVVSRARVQGDVGLHPVEADDFFGVDRVGSRELRDQPDRPEARNPRIGKLQGREVEGVLR